jgi:serine/threonine protein kinase
MSGLEALLTGRTLVKRYRIGEVIGRGGFAAVYRAEDDRLGRPVAVKVITYPAPDAETREHLRERFQREARAAASMPQHPNVVTVHDFGTDPELGLDFLVMEFLHGENLATYLDRQGRPPLDLALRILRETAEGLCIGHRAGLVHRDVKPGNIFLAQPSPDAPLRVCLLDFGIAHLVEEGGESTRLTKAGFTPHSPAYASPEQLRGDTNLSPASDVFSLGVVGYQLLTGEKPFGDERRRGEAGWTPARSIRELNPEVPVAVEEVLRRAMAYDPAERFADAGEMASALDRATGAEATVYAPVPLAAAPAGDDDRTLLQVTPPPAPPPPPRDLPSRRVAERRQKSGFPAWLGVILILALAGVAGLWAMNRRGSGPSSERAGAAPLPDSAAEATGLEPDGAVSGGDEGDEGAAAREAVPPPATGALGEGEAGEGMNGRTPIVQEPAAPAPIPADTLAGSGTPLPAQPAPASPGAQPAGTPPAAQPQGQGQQPATQPVVPPSAEPASPTPAPASRDTMVTVPSPPPRLLGRPAHPDSARADTTGGGFR